MRLPELKSQGDSAIYDAPPPPKEACSKKWAELIKIVYEVNLQCPKCLHEIRIVAIINDPHVVEKILKHLLHEANLPKKWCKGWLEYLPWRHPSVQI